MGSSRWAPSSRLVVQRTLDGGEVEVLGGCCGIWDEHLGAIAQQLGPLKGAV